MYETRSNYTYDHPNAPVLKAEYLDPVTNKTVYILEEIIDLDKYMAIRTYKSIRETGRNIFSKTFRCSTTSIPKDPLIVLPPIIQS